MELWKPISECEGRYEVSNYGNVRNTKTGLLLSPRPNKRGYLRVHMSTINGRKDFYIHRLVANAFCEHSFGHDVINHRDNNPKNNKVENLEWVTQRENVLHAMRQNRVPNFPNAKAVIGEKNGKKVTYHTAHEAEECTGCNHSAIIKCCKGIKNHTHGFTWKYAGVSV